jgi:dolichol-phosphate mannosyltransferase
MPLRLCTTVGALIAAAGLAYAVVLVIRALLGVATPSGWPTVLVIVLVLGGAQLAVIGVIGEYLWRAVEEARARPLYVVRDVWGSAPAAETAGWGQPRHGRRPASDHDAPGLVPAPDPARTTLER